MSSSWYIYKDEQQKGPISWDELYQKAQTGSMRPDDLVWTEGMEGWVQAETIEELFSVTPPPTQPPAPPPSEIPPSHTGAIAGSKAKPALGKDRGRLFLVVAGVLLLVAGAGYLAYNFLLSGASDWTGEWDSTWGYYEGTIEDIELTLLLSQDDEGNVAGTYHYGRTEGEVTGAVDGRILEGIWTQNNLSDTFEFTMSRNGRSFQGVWFQGGEEAGYWNGKRLTDELVEQPIGEPEEEENEELALYPLTSLVEVQWNGDWYDAQVLEVEGSQYYITYLGYDSSWDEWVDSSRIRERAIEPAIDSVKKVQIAIDHGANLTKTDLPETLEVVLKDGSKFLAGVEWDTTAFVSTETGEFPLSGSLKGLPVNVSNPDDIKPVLSVRVRDLNGYASVLRTGGETKVDGLLFYIEPDQGAHGYYFGTNPALDLTHLVIEDNNEFIGMIVFNAEMYPIQWIFPDLTIAVTLPGDAVFDPKEAIHVFIFDEEEANFTFDIELDDSVELVLEKTLAVFGPELADQVQVLKQELQAKGWLSKTVAEVNALADTSHEISLASMLSVASVGVSMIDQLESIAEVDAAKGDQDYAEINLAYTENELTIATLSNSARVRQEIAKRIMKLGKLRMGGMLIPMLAYLYRIATLHYDGLDIEGPAVSMLLCKGVSSVPNVCHEFYMPNIPGNASRCVNICLTSLSCFTDICHPMKFSVEDALNLRGP